METNKNTWEKPQLVILARGTPEESVLEGCKNLNFPWQGPNGSITQNHCAESETNCKGCKPEASGQS